MSVCCLFIVAFLFYVRFASLCLCKSGGTRNRGQELTPVKQEAATPPKVRNPAGCDGLHADSDIAGIIDVDAEDPQRQLAVAQPARRKRLPHPIDMAGCLQACPLICILLICPLCPYSRKVSYSRRRLLVCQLHPYYSHCL